jgi:AcrR family transcriptional regulator
VRSRRLDYSESTRKALVESAVELFTKQGYSATSLDAVAKRALVTKGALYHHFTGKQALFEAALDAVEAVTLRRLGDIIGGPGDPWERAMSAVRAYVKVCLDPSYQRIVIHEAPVVMGWERWRETEEHYSYGLVKLAVERLIEAELVEDLPVETTARMLFGAMSSGAMVIAGAADQRKASAEVSTVLVSLLEGMRRR